MIIKNEELIDFLESQFDPVGRVYIYNGEIVRVINHSFKKHTERLLESGLIDRLVKKELLVPTRISENVDEEGRIILEHRYIYPQTNRMQWSFEMRKDAAKLVLEINMICWEYGYELKDCHPANVLFDGIKPIYVDFGSIVKRSTDHVVQWTAREEFLRYYFFPLKIWERGYEEIASYNLDIKEMRSLLYHIPVRFMNFSCLKDIHGTLGKSPLLEMKKFYKKIDRLDYKKDTIWGNYQDDFWQIGCARFEREIEWMKKAPDIKSMTEVGANQGFFSYLVATKTDIKRIIATDYDKKAVDIMYRRLKAEDVSCKITPMVMDFGGTPIQELKKYRSDLVVANALTHHLLLAQKMKMHAITERLAELTNKYVIVEFMEYGLYHRKLCLPKWYTLDFFLDGLGERFSILLVKKTERTRTMIVGEKKE